MTNETVNAVASGLGIVVVSSVVAESWWLLLRPQSYRAAMACWMVGLLSRVFLALAGLAICIALLHLSAPPLVVAMMSGYVVVLALETRLAMRRLARLNK